MTEMESAEDNPDIAALQALAYEGTPLENALDFRERGNECFKVKGYVDAREFYKKGIDILWLEERKRRLAGKVDWLPQEKETESQQDGNEEEEGKEELSPEELEHRQKDLLETMYVNRAACNLALANYRACWLDCMAALRMNPRNLKAYYRATKALLSVDRIAEADDLCARGLALDPGNKALLGAANDLVARSLVLEKRQREEQVRVAKAQLKGKLLRAALTARGIVLRESGGKPPDMQDAVVHLTPDEYSAESKVAVPVVVLYPKDMQSDFVKAWREDQSLGDHLEYIFPLPWDERGRYKEVESYVETSKGTLLKMGRKVPLLKVLEGGKVEVVDGVVRVYVVPKGEAPEWVAEWKEAKAMEAR